MPRDGTPAGEGVARSIILAYRYCLRPITSCSSYQVTNPGVNADDTWRRLTHLGTKSRTKSSLSQGPYVEKGPSIKNDQKDLLITELNQLQ